MRQSEQEFFRKLRTIIKSLELSACSSKTAGRRIQTVQATFKVISFWRDLGAFVTFSRFQCTVYKLIYLLTYLLTHS